VSHQPALQIINLFQTVAREAACGEFAPGEAKLRVVS